ncbi:photosystem II reaction center protein Psb28 [Hydrococcus rivularis NIES-593]|uniref:Photosystem II reaction center Psb28 protein n=1 Tax=Hydrococcus rivularis NIES-593 TaxID=1921803 RepID=A0A1U7HQR6_9CYAN|nr:photosystem II reaction center protein Psb28 [Hydrococcus rivularis]OKH25950.1 photosystem II reaction center protein Psb28 [Hydrococcus rivularis NIES-593]
MSSSNPSIEFFVGLSEELENVSLRQNKDTGVRSVLMTFKTLKALEKFQSFTQKTYGDLRLIDSEGEISIEPASLKIIYGGDDGDDLIRVECKLEIYREDHWERLMRFLHRYAEANGMGYQEKGTGQGTED